MTNPYYPPGVTGNEPEIAGFEHHPNCPQHEDNWVCDDPVCKIRPLCRCEDIQYDLESDAADQARDEGL